MKASILTTACLVSMAYGYPNYHYFQPPENWIAGQEGPMGTGKLRDGGDFSGACYFPSPNFIKNYKPNKIYSFRVKSSIFLGFKVKVVGEDNDQDTGLLMGRKKGGKVQRMCSNGDMDPETRTFGKTQGKECWSPSYQFAQGWFRWKAPSKPGMKLEIRAICASGHTKKGQAGPMSFAVREPMASKDGVVIPLAEGATAAPTAEGETDLELCAGFDTLKTCKKERKCYWSKNECHALPISCQIKRTPCIKSGRCAWKNGQCMPKPCSSIKKTSCTMIVKQGFEKTGFQCIWNGKKCEDSTTDAPTAAPTTAKPTAAPEVDCTENKNKNDCGAVDGCKWRPKKKDCIAA